MGKDSLLKSTSKKKRTTKKKDTEKKAAAAMESAPVKKAAPKAAPKAKAAPKPKAAPKAKATPETKAATKPAADAKTKTTVKAQATAKPKETATPKPAKEAKTTAIPAPAPSKKKAAPRKKVSVETLLMEKFTPWKPKTLFRVEPGKADSGKYVSPPFFTDVDDADVPRLKAMLLEKIDLKTAAKAPGKAKQPEKAETPGRKTEISVPTAATAGDKPAEKPAAPAAPILPDQDPEPEFEDPINKGMKFLAAAAVLLVALILSASFSNKAKYYVKTVDGALEIRQGDFAPVGTSPLVSLPGGKQPEPLKSVYTKEEAYPIVFHYYIDKSDALLLVPGLPDLENIKANLIKAKAYASSKELQGIVDARLNNIDRMILLYKADVTASKGTLEDLEMAKALLEKAAGYEMDVNQSKSVSKKIKAVNRKIERLKKRAGQKHGETAPSM